MKQIKIEDYHIIHGVPPPQPPESRMAIDTEFSQMNSKKLHRPTGIFACATFYAGGKDVYIVEDVRDLAQATQNVEKAGWIFHNSAFDLFHLRRYIVVPQRKKLWDTMLVEQVRFSGMFKEFNLAACCRRDLDLFLEKEVRDEFESHSGELTPSQVEYACKDTIATLMLFYHQKGVLDKEEEFIWKGIELDYLWTVIGKSGIPLNEQGWKDLYTINKERADTIQLKYGQKVHRIGKRGQECKTWVWEGLNLRSNPLVLEKIQSLGHDVLSTGKKIIENLDVGDDEDIGINADDYEVPFIKDLINFRKFDKRSNTYGQKFLDAHLESDGMIYPSILQREAETTRSSSRSPNGQNLPNKDTKEFRTCIVSGNGYKLVDADYSSQEPRIAAEFSQDENLISIFHSGKDIYVAIAEIAFNEIIEKKSERRSEIKALVLGVFYGKTKWGLAKDLKISIEEAQKMIGDFFLAFPKVKTNYVDKMEKFAKENGYVKSMKGSKLWVNLYSGQWKRNSVNSPIQGTAAEMVKIAVNRFEKEWDGNNFYDNLAFILPVHDEILLRVKEEDAERAKECLMKHMLEVAKEFHPAVPAQVECGIADNWADAHG